MNTYAAIASLIAVGSLLLFLALTVLALVWRHMPLSQPVSDLLFITVALLVCTPVPVGLGVGAMYYPVAVLYGDLGQLKWHLGWYARAPELVVPSIVLTAVFAYFLSHRLFPNKSRRSNATAPSASSKP